MSVYGQIDRDVWSAALPMSWDKVQAMHKYLNNMTWEYQLTFEARLINNPLHPSIRCTLVKWGAVRPGVGLVVPYDKGREVLLQTHDSEQMEAVLFMLINEAEQQLKQSQRIKPSMVP